MCRFGLCLVIDLGEELLMLVFVLNVVGDTFFAVQLICVSCAFLSTVVNARCDLKGC